MSFCKEMAQPLAVPPTSPTREEREPQASRPYAMPLVDLRQILEGDIPQDKMTFLFFVKEGIRKLSDLNTVIGNNTIYFNRWRLFAWTSSVEQELQPQKIEKHRVRPCPKGQVTVSEQILSLTNPAHSGHSTQRTRGTNWQYQAHTSKSTVPRKEMCHSGKPVPSMTKSAVSWLMRRT